MSDERPIIIKKVKKVVGGHHGGAWKVAYADFVTAMMAFFLLLWLLSTADDATLVGIAEYFEPTIGVKDSLGIGFEGGENPDSEANIRRSEASPVGIVVGQAKQGPIADLPKAEAPVTGDEQNQLYEQAEEFIKNAFESDPSLRELTENVIVEQSPEGLKISVADTDKNPMFSKKSAELTLQGKTILGRILPVIEAMPNYISVTGHTDVQPQSEMLSNYTNWELSTDRANSARRYLLKAGMELERTQKVVGLAASELLIPDVPSDPRNRRVTIILLRGDYMRLPDWSLPAARDLLAVPGSANEAATNAQKAEQKAEEEEREKVSTPSSSIPEFYQ